MAALTTQKLGLGTTLSMANAAGGGDTAPCGDNIYLVVTNGSGGSINVTLDVTKTDSLGRAEADLVVAVGAGVTRYIGPLRKATFANPTTKRCGIAYSSATSVTVAVIGA